EHGAFAGREGFGIGGRLGQGVGDLLAQVGAVAVPEQAKHAIEERGTGMRRLSGHAAGRNTRTGALFRLFGRLGRTAGVRTGGSLPPFGNEKAGKDKTLVGLSLPRHSALRVPIWASSEKTTLSSEAPFAPVSAKAAATALSTRRVSSASAGQTPASTKISMSTG